MKDLGLKESDGKVFYRGKGCKTCKGTGYKGRIAINELLMPDDEIRRLINEKVSATEIKIAAEKNDMKTLRKDGIDKAVKGVTTLEEVLRVPSRRIEIVG